MASTHLSLHYHIVFSTKNREASIATVRLADVVRDIKAVSSKWVHEETGDRAFAWQEGYGAFSVSPSHREIVRN